MIGGGVAGGGGVGGAGGDEGGAGLHRSTSFSTFTPLTLTISGVPKQVCPKQQFHDALHRSPRFTQGGGGDGDGGLNSAVGGGGGGGGFPGSGGGLGLGGGVT